MNDNGHDLTEVILTSLRAIEARSAQRRHGEPMRFEEPEVVSDSDGPMSIAEVDAMFAKLTTDDPDAAMLIDDIERWEALVGEPPHLS